MPNYEIGPFFLKMSTEENDFWFYPKNLMKHIGRFEVTFENIPIFKKIEENSVGTVNFRVLTEKSSEIIFTVTKVKLSLFREFCSKAKLKEIEKTKFASNP